MFANFYPDYLVVDTNNLIFRTLDLSGGKKTNSYYEAPKRSLLAERNMSDEEKLTEDIIQTWKFSFLQALFSKITTIKPKKGVILLYDFHGSWRRDIYPPYKANRKTKPSRLPISKEVFFEKAESFLSELHGCLGQVKVVKIEAVEADDSIAVLVRDNPGDKFLFLSTDSDLFQLYKYKNYRQTKDGRVLFEIPNPALVLEDKVILGDRGDNIPGIKFRVGPRTLAKYRNEGSLHDWIHGNKDIEDNYIRNKKLIDLEYIPDEVVEKVRKTYSSIITRKNDEYAFWDFLTRHKLKNIEQMYMMDINAYFRSTHGI